MATTTVQESASFTEILSPEAETVPPFARTRTRPSKFMPFFRVPFHVSTGPLAEMSASTWQFTEKSALKLPGLLAR